MADERAANQPAPNELTAFIDQLLELPVGYSKGHYQQRRYSVVITTGAAGKRYKLYAEQLGGDDFISLNLYLPVSGKPLLKPCEMPAEKVIEFVLGYQPREPQGATAIEAPH